MPDDPYLTYNQPGRHKKPTNESFPTPPSAPRAPPNSSNKTTPTMPAAAAARPQATKLAGITVRPHNARARTRTANDTTLPSAAIDTAKSRAPPKSSTAIKKPAAANPAAQQVKQAEIAMEPRNTRQSPTTARSTTGTTIAIDTAEPRTPRPTPWATTTATTARTADVFAGTLVKMPGDGSCLLHSLALGDAVKLREQVVTWLRVNPNYPFLTSTLAAFVLSETGEAWPEYCNRMQHAHAWAGIPELVATAQVQRVGVRVFADVGRGHFHLRAILGEEFIINNIDAEPIDVVYGSNHYDSLISARPLKTWECDAVQHEKPAAPLPCGPEEPSTPTVPKEPETPTRELLKVLDELAAHKESKHLEERKERERHEARRKLAERTAFEQIAGREPELEMPEQLLVLKEPKASATIGEEPVSATLVAPKKFKKARSVAWKRRKVRRARDARKAREFEARELLCAQAREARRALAVQQLGARQALEQREAWGRRDELRKLNQACPLPKNLPRPETVEWKPTFETRGTNDTRASEERTSHVRLLFANIDGGAPVLPPPHVAPCTFDGGTPVPPPLHAALCALLPRQPPAPYMRGVAPRVFGKDSPKDIGELGPACLRKPYFPPNSMSIHHIMRSSVGCDDDDDDSPRARRRRAKAALWWSCRRSHTLVVLPSFSRNPGPRRSPRRDRFIGPIPLPRHEQTLRSRRCQLRERRRASRKQRACAKTSRAQPCATPRSTARSPIDYRAAIRTPLHAMVTPTSGTAVQLSIALWDAPPSPADGSTPDPARTTVALDAPVHVFVKSLAGRTLTLGIGPNDLIAEIKSMIQDKDGAPAPRLILGGKQLEDELTVADYHIQKDDTLHVLGRIVGAGRRHRRHDRTPMSEPAPPPATPHLDEPPHWDRPPTHFGLGVICETLHLDYDLEPLMSSDARVAHETILRCKSARHYDSAYHPLVNHEQCTPARIRFGDYLTGHPQIALVMRALDIGGVHAFPTRAPEVNQSLPRPPPPHNYGIAATVRDRWADPRHTSNRDIAPGSLVVSTVGYVCYTRGLREGDPESLYRRLDTICKAIADALATSALLEKLLLLPLLYPGYAHASMPFSDHPWRFLGLDETGLSFRRVLLIPPVGPENWLNRLEGLAKAFHITFEHAAINHLRTTVSFGCKRSLHSFDQDAVYPLLLTDVEEYVAGANSRIMMPRGGWCLEGYGPSYRSRLEHAAFRIYCLALSALADNQSLLGGIMRRSPPWRCTALPLEPFVPAAHSGGPGENQIEFTADPWKIDTWLRHHLRQHLTIDCRTPHPYEEGEDGRSPIIALQVEQDALIIDDIRAVELSPLLRYVLNSTMVAKITGYKVAAWQVFGAVLHRCNERDSSWFDISEFIPFVKNLSLNIVLDILGYGEPISLTTELVGGHALWWETGRNRLSRDPLFVTALLSDFLYLLSIEEPHYLIDFKISWPNPRAYPPCRIDNYQRFYRGGDTSPHHSKCSCFTCTGTRSGFHCTLEGTVSQSAAPPPYHILSDLCSCLCARNFHPCRCHAGASYTRGNIERFMRDVNAATSHDDHALPKCTTLTRHGGLPTLVEGLSLQLDDESSSGYWGVEKRLPEGFVAIIDQRSLGTFRTATQAAVAIARTTATPHLLDLPVELLEIVLRRVHDANALYKSSLGMRRHLRLASYAIHLDKCLRDYFLRPKPEQPTSYGQHQVGNFERVEFATITLLDFKSLRIIHPAINVVAPTDGTFLWASNNTLCSKVARQNLVDERRNAYLLTELQLDWIERYAPDWRKHIDTTPRRSSGDHEDVVGSLLVAIRFVNYAGYIVVCALVRQLMRDHLHIGRDATHGNPVKLCASTHYFGHYVLVDKVGSLDLKPSYAYNAFSCWGDVVDLISRDFGGTVVDPTTALGMQATPTSATPIIATIRRLSCSSRGTTLYEVPAPESDLFNAPTSRLSATNLDHYSHGMCITAHLHFSHTLVRVLITKTNGYREDAQLVDRYLLLPDDATTADLYHRVATDACGAPPLDLTLHEADGTRHHVPDDSTIIQLLPYYTNGILCTIGTCHAQMDDTTGVAHTEHITNDAATNYADYQPGKSAGSSADPPQCRDQCQQHPPGHHATAPTKRRINALHAEYHSTRAQRVHALLTLSRPGQAKRSETWPIDDTSNDSNSNEDYRYPHHHLRHDFTRATVATAPSHTHAHHATSSIRLRGSGPKKSKKPAVVTPTRGTFDALDEEEDEAPLDDSHMPSPSVAGPSTTLGPADHTNTLFPPHAPAPLTDSTTDTVEVSTTPTSHAPELVAHFDPSAGDLFPPTPPPIARIIFPDLENLRAVTATHSTSLHDLGSDLITLSNEFRQFRGETAHVSADLHLLSDQFRQFTSSQRASDQLHQDTSARLALQMESNARAQSDKHDASRDELSSTLRLFASSVDTKIDEMRSLLTSAVPKSQTQDEPTPRDTADELPPTVAATGADRFTLPPFGRGRPLSAPRPHSRLRHPVAAGPTHTYLNAERPQATDPPNHDLGGSPHRHRDTSHPRPLGDSPPHPHDKRHAAYCRSVDIPRVDGSKLYAIIVVVEIDKTATAFVSEQFRIWTFSRPQTTSITIETAVWSLFRIAQRDALHAFADYNMHFDDFADRLQHGEDTNDSLDGILRITIPHTLELDADRSIPNVVDTLVYCGLDEGVRDITTSHVLSCAAVKAASTAHLAPLPSPTRIRERNIIRTALLHALMQLPYSEDPVSAPHGDFGLDAPSPSSESSRRTLWNRLPQLDVAGALPPWSSGLSIQDFQQLLLTTLHTDTASLLADLLRETDPLQTILAAILRRHHDSAEFTTIVSADVAEHLKSELGYYREHSAHTVIEAQRNPADPRLQRSFLSVLCVCLAAIRSAFLGTSRDGALHSEARQFLTQLATMKHTSDVDYLLGANSYWLRYSKLWGPNLLLNLCEGGQIQTLLPSVTARLTPAMQERILLFFGDIAHRLRTAHDAGDLPKAFALQLSSILGKPLLLHSTIPSLSTYAEFSNQVEGLSDLHRNEMNRGIHTHRIAHPADLAFVGKTGALADWWPAMIRHVLGHHKRILVAPHEQIALVAWDDIQTTHLDDDVLQVTDNPRFRPGQRTIERQHDRLATAADTQFQKLEANVNKAQTQIETRVGSLKDSLESTLEAKVGSLQVNIQKHLDTIQSTISKVSKDLGSRLDKNDASMAAFHEMNAHNAQTMQHCLANVAASTTDLKHAATIKDTAAAIGRHTRAHPVHLPPHSGSTTQRPPPIHELAVTHDDTADAMSHLFCIASATHDVSSLEDLVAWIDTDDLPDESELLALTYNRRPTPSSPGALKLMKWPALRFEDLTEKAKELYRRRDKVTSADAYNTTTDRQCINCPPESRLMPHLENRCPTIYRHTGQGQKDRDAVRLARDAERLHELQTATENK